MNITRIYIEIAIREHPRVKKICQRFPNATLIACERYGEVFNPKAQNFRLQKQQPALILAEKYNNFVLPTPEGYGIGATRNYYFSHILNCLYDCRYCFLQGMYQSANYVLFVNYEDYQQQINHICQASASEPIHFFSGYDGDSLALEPITDFTTQFLPIFANIPNAWLELRTKSTQIRSLLTMEPLTRCIVAFSLSPHEIAQKVEAKAPTLVKRLEAMVKLQQHGWSLGLRFDPLIYHANYKALYQQLFAQVFAKINLQTIHSVSLGTFRLPKKYFKNIYKLYPKEKLFASPLHCQQGNVSYKMELAQQMMDDCSRLLLNYIPQEKFFPCLL
jgi:spore photoproduct lyase